MIATVSKADRDLYKYILDAPFATCVQINNMPDDTPELQAIAKHRLEASHHAELVEALKAVRCALHGALLRRADAGPRQDRRQCMSPSLLELAQRCEQATGLDYDLDHAIWDAVRGDDNDGAPNFTGSFDAAVMLTEGDARRIDFGTHGDGSAWARVYTNATNAGAIGESDGAASEILAICAAALRARAA